MAVQMPGAPTKRTTQPIVTGTSVLACKFDGGVMMCADTLGSYGSLARFVDVRRMKVVGKETLVGASGDYSDFQYISDLLDELAREERLRDDGASLTAPEIHSYLTRVLYNRRNKQDPLWNSLVVAGFKDGAPSLGTVDLIGTSYEEDHIATGFGSHLATPILRTRWAKDLTEAEARGLLEDCMRVLLYRDCRTINKIQFASIKADGATIAEPIVLDTKWDYASFVHPKAGADTGGSW